MIDEVELNQLSKTWYRDQLAFSPQEPKFIDGTLKDNLVGSNTIEESDFLRIIKEVDLANYINSRENGVDALLEDRGETLPVGIRKRMSLARAMVKSCQLIVFDEPTEGLDKIGRDTVTNLINNELKIKRLLLQPMIRKLLIIHILIDMSNQSLTCKG